MLSCTFASWTEGFDQNKQNRVNFEVKFVLFSNRQCVKSWILIANQFVLNSALVSRHQSSSRHPSTRLLSLDRSDPLQSTTLARGEPHPWHAGEAARRVGGGARDRSEYARRHRAGLRHRLRLRPARLRRRRRPAAPRLRGGACRRRADAHQGRSRGPGRGRVDTSGRQGRRRRRLRGRRHQHRRRRLRRIDPVRSRGPSPLPRQVFKVYLEPNPPHRCFD
jgi:hypothetical protein